MWKIENMGLLLDCYYSSIYRGQIYNNIKNQIALTTVCFCVKLNEVQKQPFANVLQTRCSQKFRNIYRKTPMLESFSMLFF